MIRKFTEARQSSMEKVLGGKGTLRHHHIVEPDELLGLGRLCARTVLPPGSSFGLHRHTAEIEIYHILRGEGLYNDNGTLRTVAAGDTTMCCHGEAHAIENTGTDDLEMISIVLNTAHKNPGTTPRVDAVDPATFLPGNEQ